MSDKSGIVYILSNPSFKDSIYKIGMTQRTAEKRAIEIYLGATGVPTPFIVEYIFDTSNCFELEQLVHERLKAFRLNNNREFFEINISDAMNEIESSEIEIENTHKEQTTANIKMLQVILLDDSRKSRPLNIAVRTKINISISTACKENDSLELNNSLSNQKYVHVKKFQPISLVYLFGAIGNSYMLISQADKNTPTYGIVFFSVLSISLFIIFFKNMKE